MALSTKTFKGRANEVSETIDEATPTERDLLIRQLADEKAEVTRELATLQPQLDEAIAELERLDEPRKRREKLGHEVSVVKANSFANQQALRAQIERSIPAELKLAIGELKKQLSVRSGESWQRCERAINRLEALAYEPGDLRPKIREIALQLAESDLQT